MTVPSFLTQASTVENYSMTDVSCAPSIILGINSEPSSHTCSPKDPIIAMVNQRLSDMRLF